MRSMLFIPLCTAVAFAAVDAAAQPAEGEAWTAEGRIEDNDARDADERRYDEHRLRLEAGRRYRISAASVDFDTLIRLYQAGESDPVAENDDYNPEENLDSQIGYTPEETGDYLLRVLSFAPEGRGAWSARAEMLPPLPAPVSGQGGTSARTRWRIWQGELSESDPDRDGRRFDDYLISMRAGETRLISAEAEGFDAMIWVLRAAEREGEPLDIADDSGPGVNALLGFQAEDDGDYIVRVTTFGSAQSGSYRLRISEPLNPPIPLPPPAAEEEVEPVAPEDEPPAVEPVPPEDEPAAVDPDAIESDPTPPPPPPAEARDADPAG